jgi:hypothetical protein
MRRNEDILGFLLSGGIGYLLGQESFNEWKFIVDAFKQRFEQLSSVKSPFPWSSLKSNPNVHSIYRQSLYSYLFGLPDACLPTLSRVLELSLKSKYEAVEGKKPSNEMDLARLTDWAESYVKNDSTVADSFRLMRNLVHTDTFIQEQDCLEGIRHLSTILEKLQPSQNITLNVVCHYCKTTAMATVPEGQNYLGNKITRQCEHCKKTYHWMIMP